MAAKWDLMPGDNVRRTELHQRYAGSPQGGVSPSRGSPNILLFTDPSSGLRHGYVDHWDGSAFHYTGEGQRGDQQMVAGNKCILQHVSDKRSLRVFRGARGVVQYVGEFDLDPDEPWYGADAQETGGGPQRSVIVFRLIPRPEAMVTLLPADIPTFQASVDEVPIAEMNTEKVWVDPERPATEAELREAKLVKEFTAWLVSRGHPCCRLRIVPDQEAKPLFSDVWVPSLQMLVEAKGSVNREAIRMAIGQLIDYGRFKPGAKCTLLLPSKPRTDLCNLIKTAGFDLFWYNGTTFIAAPLDKAKSTKHG